MILFVDNSTYNDEISSVSVQWVDVYTPTPYQRETTYPSFQENTNMTSEASSRTYKTFMGMIHIFFLVGLFFLNLFFF